MMKNKNKTEQIAINQAEKRRQELNNNNANNGRLKLGLSRKNWKKLKQFNKQYNYILEDNLAKFTSKLLELNLKPDDHEAAMVFDHYEKRYRSAISPLVYKLRLHNKDGRDEVFNRFSYAVSKLIKGKEEAQKEEEKGLDSKVVVEIISMALKLGAEKDKVNLPSASTYKELIKGLKVFIPRGGKGKFEQQANDYVKKLGLS